MSTQNKMLSKNAQLVFKGVIFDVYHWEQELYDGTTTTYEKLIRADTVVVIGVTRDQKILLIQEEQPDRAQSINAVAGKVETGETIEMAARREFLEETGFTFDNFYLWYTNLPEHKIVWTVHTLIAYNCVKTSQPNPEAGEKIEVKFFSFDEFIQAVLDDTIKSPHLKIKVLEAKLNPEKMTQLKKLLHI